MWLVADTPSNDAAPPLSLSEALLAYRWMALARRLDDAMWALRRQGKGHFAVSCAGHEAVGAAVGLALDRTRDVLAPHYRDLAACIAFGLTAREVMAHYFGRAADPCSGGRQPYVHWGSRARRIVTLSAGERQRVEIVRCLLQNPRLLIMDEPTSVLTPQEADILFETLRKLAAHGTAILYISHKL